MTVQTAMNSITTGLFYLAIITAIVVIIILAFMLFDYLTQPKEEPENYVEQFLTEEDKEAIHNFLQKYKEDDESSYPNLDYESFYPECGVLGIIEDGNSIDINDKVAVEDFLKRHNYKNLDEYFIKATNDMISGFNSMGYNPYQE